MIPPVLSFAVDIVGKSQVLKALSKKGSAEPDSRASLLGTGPKSVHQLSKISVTVTRHPPICVDVYVLALIYT